jgi:hypothetical protein
VVMRQMNIQEEMYVIMNQVKNMHFKLMLIVDTRHGFS